MRKGKGGYRRSVSSPVFYRDSHSVWNVNVSCRCGLVAFRYKVLLQDNSGMVPSARIPASHSMGRRVSSVRQSPLSLRMACAERHHSPQTGLSGVVASWTIDGQVVEGPEVCERLSNISGVVFSKIPQQNPLEDQSRQQIQGPAPSWHGRPDGGAAGCDTSPLSGS